MAKEEWVSDLPEIQYDYINNIDIDEMEESEPAEDIAKATESEETDADGEQKIEVDEYKKPERKEISIKTSAITLRRSVRSYVYNYMLILLMMTFFYLVLVNYDIVFTLSPNNFSESIETAVILAFFAVIAYLFKEPVIERKFRKYMITNNEVMMSEGIFRKNIVVIPYQSISNIDVYRGILGRMLNYGTISVVGFKNKITMEGVDDPSLYYRIIQNKISIKGGGTKQKFVKDKPKPPSKKTTKINWRERKKELDKKSVERKKKRGKDNK